MADLSLFPVVVLTGARQSGKTTLAKQIADSIPGSVYLDLQSPADMARLADPELFLGMHGSRLVVLDEVQRFPDIFPILRSLIDKDRRPGRFLLLGSASRRLVERSGESLAGRASFLELSAFLPDECVEDQESLFRILVRGGFPESFLAGGEEASFRWRQEFIRSYTERELPILGLRAPSPLITRLLSMLAHLQGQTLNSSKLAGSLGVNPGSVRTWIDFLEQASLLRQVPAWSGNLKKRLVKSPKLYIRDVGIVNSILEIRGMDELLGHPVWGAQWEAFVVESAIAAGSGYMPSFYRTSNGSELDLVLEKGGERIAVEANASTNPVPTRGFWNALEELEPAHTYICAPVEAAYPFKAGVTVIPVVELQRQLRRR